MNVPRTDGSEPSAARAAGSLDTARSESGETGIDLLTEKECLFISAYYSELLRGERGPATTWFVEHGITPDQRRPLDLVMQRKYGKSWNWDEYYDKKAAPPWSGEMEIRRRLKELQDQLDPGQEASGEE